MTPKTGFPTIEWCVPELLGPFATRRGAQLFWGGGILKAGTRTNFKCYNMVETGRTTWGYKILNSREPWLANLPRTFKCIVIRGQVGTGGTTRPIGGQLACDLSANNRTVYSSCKELRLAFRFHWASAKSA